jgi:hypothetical protein
MIDLVAVIEVSWLDQLELLIMIEDKFEGVQFSDATAVELVGDLIRHVEVTIQQASGSRESPRESTAEHAISSITLIAAQ